MKPGPKAYPLKTYKRRKTNGGRIGIDWAALRVGYMTLYKGSFKGAKAQVWRANQTYAPAKFCSFRSPTTGSCYIMRTS